MHDLKEWGNILVNLPAHAVGVCAHFIEHQHYSHRCQPPRGRTGFGRNGRVGGHVFWADDLQVNDLASFTSRALVGHRQVTDAYLIKLAKRHKGKVATLDAGLADLLPQTQRARFVTFIGAV